MDTTTQHLLVAVTATATAVWLIAIAFAVLVLAQARGRGDAALVVSRARMTSIFSLAAAIPAAVVVAAAGTTYVLGRDLAIDANWWIGTALGSWIVCFFGATAMRWRHLRGAVQLAQRDGDQDEEVQWRIRRVDLLARGELLLLVVAVAVVVMQPTTQL